MDIVRPINAKRTSPRSWLLAVFMLFVVVVLLWLPFGFKTTGLIEEWDAMVMLKNGYKLFFIGDDSPLAQQRIRPMLALPEVFNYEISPNTYFGLNAMAFLVVFLQGAVFCRLVKYFLPGRTSIALVAAILFMVYPGDSAQFALRMNTIRASVLFYLLSVCFLVHYWRHRQPLILLMTWFWLAVDLMFYEVSFPLVAITPLVLLWLGGSKRRRLIYVSLLWYLVPVIFAIRILLIVAQSDVLYETRIVGANTLGTLFSIQGMTVVLEALQHAYTYQFVTGWQEAWIELGNSALFTGLAIMVALLAGLICWRLLRIEEARPHVQLRFRRYLVLVAVGIIVVAVGFSPFVLSPDHRDQTDRVFLFSLIGSAFATTIGVFLISRFLPLKNFLFASIFSVLIALAMLHALNQQNLYANYSWAQQSVLAQALEQAPHIDKTAALIIFDATNRMRSPWFFGDNRVSQFRYIYDNLWLNAQICFEQLTFPDVLTECKFNKDGLHITQNRRGPDPVQMLIPYNKLILFRYFDNADTSSANFELLKTIPKAYFDDQAVATYDPEALIDKKTPISPAIQQLFECWPLGPCLGKPQPDYTNSVVEIDFGTVINGTGWRPAETSPSGIQFRWTTEPVSTLNVPVNTDKDLFIDFKIVNQITPEILHSLKLSANDAAMDLSLTTDGNGASIFHGTVPHQVLAKQPGTLHLAFSVNEIKIPPGDNQALGLAFTWLRLEVMP